MSGQRTERYVPALGYGRLTSLYDSVLRWTMREATFKRHLVDQAGIRPGQRVLDLGCGTATLTILLKQVHPQAEVHGLDADPRALEIAKRKAVGTGVRLSLDRGMSSALPYAEHSFDGVVSSLFFHHLTRGEKRGDAARGAAGAAAWWRAARRRLGEGPESGHARRVLPGPGAGWLRDHVGQRPRRAAGALRSRRVRGRPATGRVPDRLWHPRPLPSAEASLTGRPGPRCGLVCVQRPPTHRANIDSARGA